GGSARYSACILCWVGLAHHQDARRGISRPWAAASASLRASAGVGSVRVRHLARSNGLKSSERRENAPHDARSPILHRYLQSKSAPLAAPLIASGPAWRLARLAMSSERCGGAERVGVGAGAGVGGGRSGATGDRGAAGDQPADGRAARGGG